MDKGLFWVLAGCIPAAAALGSCSLPLPGPPSESVELAMPDIPAAWPPSLRLELRWRDGEGRLRREGALPGELRSIRLPRGSRRAILLEVFYRGRSLFPAGAIWPDALLAPSSPGEPGLLPLSWTGGWAASLLALLEERGEAERVDILRLQAEALARLRDPWIVDPLRVADDLIQGCFRADSLRAGDALDIPLPGPGPWFSESPLAEPPRPSEEGWVAALRPGLHRWYSGGLELFLSLGEEGETASLIRNLGEP